MKFNIKDIEYIISDNTAYKTNIPGWLVFEKDHNSKENKFFLIDDKSKNLYIVIDKKIGEYIFINDIQKENDHWVFITNENKNYKIYCKNYLMLKNLERL